MKRVQLPLLPQVMKVSESKYLGSYFAGPVLNHAEQQFMWPLLILFSSSPFPQAAVTRTGITSSWKAEVHLLTS